MASNQSSPVEPDSGNGPEKELQIVVHAGPLAGKGFLIASDVVTFGRDKDNTISWDDTQVSRHHARITRQGDRLVLEDLGSMNGTLVNGKPVEGEHILQPADIISVGSSVFGVKGFAAPHTVTVTQISQRAPKKRESAPAPPAPIPTQHSPPRPNTAPPAAQTAWTRSTMAIVGVMLLIMAVVGLAAVTAYFIIQGQNSGSNQIPTVVITAPADGRQVQVGQTTTVQTTVSDPSGVTRVELWVSGTKIAEETSPASQGQSTLTASFQWTPQAPGSYTLEIKAFNVQNRTNEPAAITIDAAPTTPTTTLTPTTMPQTPTPTSTPNPGLTSRTDLNVRAGPSTQYDLVGLLPAGARAEIIGRDDSREWWQIRFEPAPEQTGWVNANPEFSETVNVNTVPVVQAPPTPTGTPTNTPTTTPTPTPTNTTAPPTSTPTLTSTPTPTQVSANIQFDIEPTEIEGGDCVTVRWNITGVREIYFQSVGVSGAETRTECPVKTTTYTIRVIRQDNTEVKREITVEVIAPVASSGKLIVDPDETVDFDSGQIPGNDFVWEVDDDQRAFAAQSSVRIAPQGINSSLDGLTLDDCREADYDEFTYLDGSDVIIVPGNELTDGRLACFTTNEGRYGKMRFPKFSTGSLEVEWLTWQ